jgi:hypothetical protein
MRKTLTVLTVIAAASSLAACKMPWEPEAKTAVANPPVEAVEAAPPDPTTTAPTGEAMNTAAPAAEKTASPPAKPAAK